MLKRMFSGRGLLAGVAWLSSAGLASADLPSKITAMAPTQAVDARLDQGAATLKASIAKATNESGEFTVTFQEPKPGAPPPPEAAIKVGEGRIQVAAAAAAAQEATNLRRQAAQPGINPAYAEHLRSLAMQAQDSGTGWLVKAQASFAAARGDAFKPADGPPRPITLPDGSNTRAYRQLKAVAKAAFSDNGAGGLPSFEDPGTASRAPSPVAPAPDTLLKGYMVATPRVTKMPDGGTAIKPNQGAAIDLGPLHDALAEVAPELLNKPLFSACDSGGGACRAPELLRVLADPEKNSKLRKVGGVALDATFDLLAVSGLSDFRGGGDIRLVDHPVLVSLKALYAAALPYARTDTWNNLPDTVRYPGGIVRLSGFILDPESGDVILVGRTGDPDARLDIDEIIVAVRQVWRDGKTMGVSLDPRPDDIGGPQYARIVETPPDSLPAKIMIEADYMMKAIMLDAGFAHGKQLAGVAALLHAAKPEDANDLSRFWLTPQRIGQNAIYDSVSGRTTLLETRVEVRTETMELRNGEIEGVGTASSIPEQQAKAFTAAYDALERSAEVEPHAIFLQLHGLVDMVTLAKIWRARQVRADALDQIAALPYRRLTGSAAVQATYPGLSNVFSVSAGAFQAFGGVQLNLRQEANAAHTYDDHVAQALEMAAVAQRSAPALAKTLDLIFAVPTKTVGAGRDVDDALLAAAGALRHRDLDLAIAKFGEAVKDAPADPHGYAGMAFAMLEQGSPTRAAPFALRAMALAPSDESFQMLGLDVAWRIDAHSAYVGFDTNERRELSRYYVRWAAIADHDGQPDVRDRDAGWAADLWEDNGDAHVLQAFGSALESPEREQQLARAVRAFRRQLEANIPEARAPLAMALLMSASQHVLRALGQFHPGADSTPLLALLNRGSDEARQALEFEPDLPAAAATRVLADGLIWLISTPQDRTAAASILVHASAVAVHFPKDPGVHIARAQLMTLMGDPTGGLHEADVAVAMGPLDLSALTARAGLRAQQADCVGAAADMDRARRSAGKNARLLDDVAKIVTECRLR